MSNNPYLPGSDFDSQSILKTVTSTLHILSGSFRSLSLFLLAFSPLNRTLTLVQTIDAYGPHQYVTTNPKKDRAYTTSWAVPPTLSSWTIDRGGNNWTVSHLNTVDITAVSSYINIPPPYTHIYSAGGPSGEVHIIDAATRGFGERVQEVLFVPEDELDKADKTRAALRTGSHAVEFSPSTHHAFIPVLGTNSIEMYDHDSVSGKLTRVFSSRSPRGPGAHDGPRHVKIHPNGKVLYCVTEHNNFVDAYRVHPGSLEYVSSRSMLPKRFADTSTTSFRGDTLMLAPSTSPSPSPRALFTTTRGAEMENNGWLSVFELDEEGFFTGKVERYETPTSGGKANAIDVHPKSPESSDSLWVLLADDSDTAAETGGGVHVLEWNGWDTGGVNLVVSWPGPEYMSEESGRNGQEKMRGGSHAVWLG